MYDEIYDILFTRECSMQTKSISNGHHESHQFINPYLKTPKQYERNTLSTYVSNYDSVITMEHSGPGQMGKLFLKFTIKVNK